MLFSALSGNREAIITFLLTIPVILFSLSFHEAAHAFVADKMGDHTARYAGRLTLNPLKHLDPIGALSMLLVGIGWARPVPINTRNFEDPRKGMMLSALAGPVSNMILGLGFTILEVIAAFFRVLAANRGVGDTGLLVLYVLVLFFNTAAYLNFALGIFNLIPAPPFDGSRIFFYFMPKSWYFKVMAYERYIGLGILVVCLVLSRLGLSPITFLAGGLQSLVARPFYALASVIFNAVV